MSIIDKTREELALERKRHAVEVVIAMSALEILPHVANGSLLRPVEVVERAFEIARCMDSRLRQLGIERELQQYGGTVPADTRMIR